MNKGFPSFPSLSESRNRVDGILYPPFVPAEQLERLKSFPVRADDIFVASLPKSGTHWILKIVHLLLNNAEDRYIEYSPEMNKDAHWPEAAGMPGFIGEKIHDLPSPRLFVSHERYSRTAGGPPNTTQAKYIYCARNPKDVAVSFYQQYSKMKQGEIDLSWDEFTEYYLRGDIYFGSWWDHIPEWWTHRDEPNVLFLKYEDLKKDLPGNVKIMAEFLGLSVDKATIQKIAQATTIENMKVNSATWTKQQFIRKGIVGDWKNHFTPAQSEAMDALYKKATEGTGLEMEFD